MLFHEEISQLKLFVPKKGGKGVVGFKS